MAFDIHFISSSDKPRELIVLLLGGAFSSALAGHDKNGVEFRCPFGF